MKLSSKTPLYRMFGVIWLVCIVFFILLLAVSTNWFSDKVDNMQVGKSTYFIPLFLLSVLSGSLSFLVATLSVIHSLFSKFNKPSVENKGIFHRIKYLVRFVVFILFLPLFLAFRIFNPFNILKSIFRKKVKTDYETKSNEGSSAVKFFSYVFIVAFLLPLWITFYFISGTVVYQVAIHTLGYNIDSIALAGTGSMYPTFPKGEGKDLKELSSQTVGFSEMLPYPNGILIKGRRYFGYEIGRGDIVTIENDVTRKLSEELYGRPSGWVKRVVAVTGDSIELREGIVLLNNKPLEETYIAKARSTFGSNFLGECKKVVVPENSIFVMGDNRKGSGDSREVGFFSLSAVNHVLPFEKQIGVLDKNWRDTSKDFDELSKIKLNKEEYLELLNKKRVEENRKPLKYQQKLELSAKLRGEIILEYDDFSYEATRSGYTQIKAISEAGYSNIVYGEAPTLGFFESEELIENQFSFPKTKEFLLDKDYQEIGIAEVEGMLNGCPAQVVVQHFAGYKPPNYSSELVTNWENVLNQLKSVLPSWEDSRNYPSYYNSHREDLDRLIEVMKQRISRMEIIVLKMKANRWLSDEENNWTYEDEMLYNEQEALIKKLNS